jgi:hypothetical protein
MTAFQFAAFMVAAPFGIQWVAAALVLRVIVMSVLPISTLRRAGVTGYRRFAKAFCAPLLAVLVMLAGMEAVRLGLLAPLSPLARLAVLVPVAALLYLGVLALLDRGLLREVLNFAWGADRPLLRGSIRSGSRRADVDEYAA